MKSGADYEMRRHLILTVGLAVLLWTSVSCDPAVAQEASGSGREPSPVVAFEIVGTTDRLDNDVAVALPGVIVRILGTDLVVQSDSSGAFRLRGRLPAGDYSLRFAALGYHRMRLEAPIRKAVRIDMGQVVLPELPTYVGRTEDRGPCGDSAIAVRALEDARVSIERERGARPDELFDAIPPGDRGSVVRDPAACRRLLAELGERTRAEIDSGNAEYGVYRLGPYYFLYALADMPYLVIEDGDATFVFDGTTYEIRTALIHF